MYSIGWALRNIKRAIVKKRAKKKNSKQLLIKIKMHQGDNIFQYKCKKIHFIKAKLKQHYKFAKTQGTFITVVSR